MNSLDQIAQAYNFIYKKEFEEALKNFGQLYFLPVKKLDDPNQKAKIYLALDPEIKSLLFETIITIGKCVEILYNVIKRETRSF